MAFCPNCGVGGVPEGASCARCAPIGTTVVANPIVQTAPSKKLVISLDDLTVPQNATAPVPYVAAGPTRAQSVVASPQSYPVRTRPAPYVPLAQARNSGMAIAALVCGIFGFSVIAIVLGFIARSQIMNSGGREKGQGMATAGIVLGFVWIGLSILLYVIIFAALSSVSGSYSN